MKRQFWLNISTLTAVLVLALSYQSVHAQTPARPDPISTASAVQPAGKPVVADSAPQFHGADMIGIHPGTPVIWAAAVTGDAPLKFSAKNLPRGLHLDATSGILTGVAPGAGSYNIVLRVTGPAGSASETLRLVSGPPLALTPPMGWNSYDGYGDSVTEAEVLANAEYIHKNLQPYGCDTVVIDYRWYDPGAHNNDPNGRAGAALAIDSYGRLLPAPNRFPSAADGAGFEALADKIHAMGLKFGIHIMRGIPRLAVAQNLPIADSPYHAVDAADISDKCSESALRRYIGRRLKWRKRAVPPNVNATKPRCPSPRAAGIMIMQTENKRSEQDTEFLDRPINNCSQIAVASRIASDFADMIRQRQPERFEAWRNSVNDAGISELAAFASVLDRDHDAVVAGLTLPWSNGQTEGHINRLKSIKRLMYGRAAFQMLWQRVLSPM